MKYVFLSLIVLISTMSYADNLKVNCQISYVSADGVAKINVLQVIEVLPYSFVQIDLGNLSLEVGLLGLTTKSQDKIYPSVSTAIFDRRYQTPVAGQISVNPNFPAKCSYEVEESKESLSASCALSR